MSKCQVVEVAQAGTLYLPFLFFTLRAIDSKYYETTKNWHGFCLYLWYGGGEACQKGRSAYSGRLARFLH